MGRAEAVDEKDEKDVAFVWLYKSELVAVNDVTVKLEVFQSQICPYKHYNDRSHWSRRDSTTCVTDFMNK